MTKSNAAMRGNGSLLWSWWFQIGLALFAKLNIHNIDTLRGSRRVLIDYKRHSIGFVTSHYGHDNFRRGRRR
ncbi:hypothetical protein [Bradyrhizobium sp. JYMT SZCCT0428]|uniref:hypothetical protein n=1 Tax=Bradyrhizobium sp. JYMT SZCCT0428 TaxID=2807673 RepID=UPI001BA93120|nr:hypothetical protein [Bradyrhizobium sp. JYMT SZCCT0428]MBR1154046.1 hypothetical protein [Bradyrhizobium sp. JYMT SZCCT0428]